MRVRHGGFEIDIPSGWSDQSTLLFVGPRERQSGDTLQAQLPPAEAIAVTFAAATDNPRGLLEDQAAMLRAAGNGFEVLEDGAFRCPLGEGHRFVQRVDIGGPRVQIAVAIPARGVTVIATATCAAERFNLVKAQLEQVLASMGAA